MELYQQLKKVTFQPVQFSEKEISAFIYVSCRSIISVSTDTSKSDSPLWVNLLVLTNFTKLYINYWNRAIHIDTPLALEQRSMLYNILLKITNYFNFAIRHNCILSQWVDLRQLLKATTTNKKENLFLATYPHHEYDILEIEKIGLEQSKIEIMHDILDETQIKDLIIFSKLMAFQLHGIRIL